MNKRDLSELINNRKAVLKDEMLEDFKNKWAIAVKEEKQKQKDMLELFKVMAENNGLELKPETHNHFYSEYGGIFVELRKERDIITKQIDKEANDLMVNITLNGLKDDGVKEIIKKYLGM